MRVIGYAYDADLHCVGCAEKRFGDPDRDGVTDSEGNPVHPLFSTEETRAHGEHCGDCGEEIAPPWCAEGGSDECEDDRARTVDGIATILWACAWADHMEENRCRSLAGCKIEDEMLPIPQEARDLAEDIARDIEKANDACLPRLLTRANIADHRAGKSHNGCNDAARFGECLAFMATGHGVSWFDDHAEFPLEIPDWGSGHEVCDLQDHAFDTCELCSNQHRFTVVVEENPDDPWSVTFTIQGPNVTRWVDKFGAIDGGTWETAGSDSFVYDHGGLRPGCYEEWERDGWDLDLSVAPSDDPLEVFYGLEGEELEREMNRYTAIGLHENEELKEEIRERVAAYAKGDKS